MGRYQDWARNEKTINVSLLLLLSHSVMSGSLQPHGLQHTRLSCPSPSPRACSNSCPLSQWFHPTISSSVLPFSSCLQSFPAFESFLVSWLLTSGGQSIGASASASVLPMNVQDLGLTSLISLQSKRLSKSLLQHHSSKAPVLHHSAFIMVQISHLYMTTGKTIALTRWTLVNKITSLLFNTLSRFAIAFLPRSKHLLISWLQSPSAVIFRAQENKVCSCFHYFPIYEVMGPNAMILAFWMLSFKQVFSLSSFTFIKRLFSSSLLSAIKVVSFAYLRLLIFLLQSWFQLVLHPAWHFAWCTLHIS